MSFWNVDGKEITGNAKDAFTPSFAVIPDGTKAVAMIDDVAIKDYNGQYIEISWKLTTGEYSQRLLFQKIKVFDDDSKKRTRALNMLMLLYKLAGLQPPQSQPTEHDLKEFIGKHAGIMIQEWEYDGKNGNWISEVHPVDGFETKTGIKIEVVSTPAQAPLSAIAQELAVDDVPW